MITVAIPTYRGASTLGAAIDSVLAQTLGDFELLIVDDRSPDETHALVAKYADPRMRYLCNAQNLGPEGNWNVCLREARGRYFKLLPHDDVIAPHCLERQVAVLEADVSQHLALVFSARNVLGPKGERITQRGYPGGREGTIIAGDLMRSCVRRGTNLIGEPGAVLLRRELALSVGSFDATYPYVIDLDYWFRLLAHGDAHYCAEPLASFRVSPTQWSVVIGSGQAKDFMGLVERFVADEAMRMFWFDRFCLAITPNLNNFARLIFYRLYLQSGVR